MCASRALHLRVVLRSASSASSGSLWERHKLRPTPTQTMRICIFNKIPRGVLCILKFERPCNWESAHPAHMWGSITKSHFSPLTSSFLRDQDLGQNEELTTSILPPKGVVHTFYSPGLNLRSLLSLCPPLLASPISLDSVSISRPTLQYPYLLMSRLHTQIQVDRRQDQCLSGIQEKKNKNSFLQKNKLAPGFFLNYPNTQMCWDGIKIESLPTTGWKVKSNMEGMPNDLEREKDPPALVKKLWGVSDQTELKCANWMPSDAIIRGAPLEIAVLYIGAETGANSKENCLDSQCGLLCAWVREEGPWGGARQTPSADKMESLLWSRMSYCVQNLHF